MNKIINLSIACGDNFITENEWVNLDYESNNLNVIKCDVLKKIPFTEEVHGSLSSDIEIAEFGQCAIQTTETKRFTRHRNTDIDA